MVLVLVFFPAAFIFLNYLEDIAEISVGGGGFVLFVSNLPRYAIEVASSAGYPGVFVLMLLEAAAFPIPSEIILPLAGYLVSQGNLEFWPVIFYSTVAAIIGSFTDYFVGWRLGTSLVSGRSKLPYVDPARLQRAHVWFERYGPWAVMFFRLVPAARVLISFPAGAYKMGRSKFALYTLAGCLPWNITLVYLGWWLGSSWEQVVSVFRYINLVAYGFLSILAVWVVWRITSKKTRRH